MINGEIQQKRTDLVLIVFWKIWPIRRDKMEGHDLHQESFMMNFIKIRSRWRDLNNRNGIYCRRVSELLILLSSIKCQMSRQYPDEQQYVWCVVNLNRKFHACVWIFLTFSKFPTLALGWQVTLAHSSFIEFDFCILKNAVNPVNNHGNCNNQTCPHILLSPRFAITGISASRQFEHLPDSYLKVCILNPV